MLLIFLSIVAASKASHSDQVVPELSVSDWYYIKLTSEQPDHSCQGKENPTSEMLENLSNKLSVPETSFLISSLDTLSAGIISTNLSLLNPLPGLHTNMSRLQLSSPVFNICGQQYSLALLLHENSHLLEGEQRHQISHLGGERHQVQ